MPTVAITRAVVVRSQPGLAQGFSSPGVWQFPLYLPWATLLRLKCSTCLRNPCFHAAMWALLPTRPKDIPCASFLNDQVEPCDLTAIIMPCKYTSHEKCMRWLPASTCLTKNASSESVDLAEEHGRADCTWQRWPHQRLAIRFLDELEVVSYGACPKRSSICRSSSDAKYEELFPSKTT